MAPQALFSFLLAFLLASLTRISPKFSLGIWTFLEAATESSPHTRNHHSASRTTHRLCTSHSHLGSCASARSSISSSPALSINTVCAETRSLESRAPSDAHVSSSSSALLSWQGWKGASYYVPHSHHSVYSINAKLTTCISYAGFISGYLSMCVMLSLRPSCRRIRDSRR